MLLGFKSESFIANDFTASNSCPASSATLLIDAFNISICRSVIVVFLAVLFGIYQDRHHLLQY